MKQKITLLLLFVNFITFSQVGINTTSPNATLDITASNTANPANNDGILIPKIDNFPITNPTTAQDGILVYVTGAGIPLKGFYYWDNAQSTWINIQGVKKIDDLLDGKSSAGGSAVFLGVQSGLSDDGTDNRNTGLGYQSLKANVGGIYNSAIGHRALLNTTGNYNSGFGGNALFSNTTGTLNTGVGVNSLYANTTGTRNLALGVNAMRYNTTGNYNTATGNRSLFNLTVGNKNNAIGYESMYSSTGAYRNTANGFRSLYSNLTGSFNTAIGYEAGYNSLGAYNVFLGYNSGYFENGSNKLYIENRNANADNALIYGEFGTDNTNTGNILRTNSQFQIGNPALTGYAFPITDGTTGQVLQTNGSGAIAWANPLTLGTDDQNLTGATLTGTTLQITIENGNATSVDLAPLQDGGAQKINDLLDGKSNPSGETTFLGKNSGLNDSGALINKNVGLGSNTLKSNINGANNVAVGAYTLFKNTNSVNTAIGSFSMFNNITGNQNVAVGSYTLGYNVSGSSNTAVGYLALNKNEASYNTAFGGYALLNTTGGARNSAFGDHAGFYNVSGAGNVFMGFHAGFYETGSNKLYIENLHADENNALIYGDFGTDVTSTGNILRTNSQFQIGNPALTGYAFPTTDGTTGQVLQTNGSGAIAWVNPLTLGTDDQNLTGATLTGTTLQITIENGNATSVDLAPLQDGGAQKINDLLDGKSDNDGTQNGSSIFLGINAGLNDDATDNRNIGVGYQSLFMNTSGMHNTATGYMALAYNTTGNGNVAIGSFSLLSCLASNWNTAIGSEALYSNSSGNSNVAIGNKSLYSNTGGIENTAIGSNSLFSNTTGFSNTANGYQALYYNTTGYNNNANGFKALYSNTTGAANTANGISALYSNTIGNANTANGVFALPLNTIGSYNTATGFEALRFNTTGSYNTATGINALYSNTTGYNNTAIGYAASYGGNYNNSSSLGYNTIVSASNMARIGNTAVSSIGGYANWSNVSDKRFKTNVKENVPGINFIKKLRPVTYNLDMEALARFNKTPDSLRLKDAERLKAKETQIGFIAQEVETAANEIGFNFHGVEKPKNPQSHYGLRYAEFVVPLVKAVQEQQIIIETLKEDAKIKDNEIKELRKELNQQKKNIETIIRLLNKDN